MAPQPNCWEIKQCGRQPGGTKVAELGVCPAATDVATHGLNGGKNGGRICWAVTGTFCGGKIQGSYAEKQVSCMNCEFFKAVQGDAGKDFVILKPGQQFKPAVRR